MAETPVKSGQPVSRTPLASAGAQRDPLNRRSTRRPNPRDERPSFTTRLFEGLRTLLWVIPLTLLLWVYAEREQIAPVRDVQVPIEVRTSSPDRVVALISPEDRRIYLDYEGPRRSLDEVRDLLGDGKPNAMEIYVPDDLPPGFEGDISATDRIGKNEIFRDRAITVTRSRPAVRVRVEKKVSRTLAVKVRPEDSVVGVVAFEPETVNVEGPESLFKQTPADRLVVYADLSKFAREKPGKYEGDVPLAFSAAVPKPFRIENVSLPKTVHAKVDIQRSQQDMLQSIPVLVQIPARILEADRYKVTVPVTLPNVAVAGPPETIQQLKSNKLSGMAVIELSPDDFAPSTEPVQKAKRLRPEDYRMPKDVTVINPEREITVTITDRGG